jgi:hypothetical protein
MSDALTNRSLYDRSRINWSRDQYRQDGHNPGITEYELAAAVHEGASSVDKVREYLKHRKHPFASSPGR